MTSLRPAEPEFECFSVGHTSLMDHLQLIEKAPYRGHDFSVSDLMWIHLGFKKALAEFEGFSGGSLAEREALATRLRNGMEKTKNLLQLPWQPEPVHDPELVPG